MADPSWLDKNNITSVRLKTSTGTVEIGQLEAFGLLGQTFLVTLYSLTTFFALTGNTLVILVEIYGRRSARNLQKFLINLAISDLLLGVLVAPFIYTDIMLGRWIFHPLLCPATQFVQLMSVFVTTYTLTFIGIERYFATLHPLSTANTWLRSHGNLVLQLGWIFGSTLASFSIQNTRVVAFKYDNQTYYDCANWVDVTERDMQIYVLLSFVLTFVLPIIFLTISYGAIGRRLMRTQKYWCSYKQTVPFSQHSASRTHSSLNSSSSSSNPSNSNCNNRNGKPMIMITTNDCRNESISSPSNIKMNGNNVKQSSNNSNLNRHTNVKPKKMNGNNNNSSGSSGGGSIQHMDSQDSARHSKSKSMNDPNKVVVRFDRRNTEFLNKMRVFRLLVSVLVLFIICWLPIKIFMLILAFFPSIVYLDSITSYYIYYVSFFLCHWLSMANSFANPILYCFMSKSFRADLLDLFVCICTKFNICIKSCERLKENQPYVYNHQRHHHNHSYNGINYRLASIKETRDADKDVINIVDVQQPTSTVIKESSTLEITNVICNNGRTSTIGITTNNNINTKKKYPKNKHHCLSVVDELTDPEQGRTFTFLKCSM